MLLYVLHLSDMVQRLFSPLVKVFWTDNTWKARVNFYFLKIMFFFLLPDFSFLSIFRSSVPVLGPAV